MSYHTNQTVLRRWFNGTSDGQTPDTLLVRSEGVSLIYRGTEVARIISRRPADRNGHRKAEVVAINLRHFPRMAPLRRALWHETESARRVFLTLPPGVNIIGDNMAAVRQQMVLEGER